MSLDDTTVCMLVTNDVSRDTRVRREARSLMDAGAAVTIIGVGDGDPISPGDLDIRLLNPVRASTHPSRLIRIVVNVFRTLRFERSMSAVASGLCADIYHCNDLDTLAVGARAASRAGARLVYDSHELFLEGEGTVTHWQRPLWARTERRWLPRADLVITVNDLIAEELATKYRVRTPLVVFNGPAQCASAGTVATPLRIFFQGSYTEGRALDELGEAMVQVRDVATLALQGYGPLEERLRRRVSELGLGGSVEFVPPCAPEDTAQASAEYDVGVVGSTMVEQNSQLASPNKLFSYLGGALALLIPDLPVMRSVVERYECGMIVPEMTPQALADAIRWMAEHPEDVARMKQGAVRACAEYSWEMQAKKLVDAYAQMLGRGTPS